MIVHRRTLRSAREHRARVPRRCDAAILDENRAVLDIAAGRRARRSGIVGEGEDAPADEVRAPAQERMSFSLSAAIRSISASAALISASTSLASRRSKAARISSFLLPLTAMMKGKPKRAL